MIKLDDYIPIIGEEEIEKIHNSAKNIQDKHILHINSTYQGGGVAELLSSLVPLMNDAGVDAGWRILHGSPDFFGITKSIHNALQGEGIKLSKISKEIYETTNEDYSVYTHIDHDFVFIHDPQPLPQIDYHKKRQPWFWRCHIDMNNNKSSVFRYLLNYINKYDGIIVSNKNYRQKEIEPPQKIVHPAIDPLSPKNQVLESKRMDKFMKRYAIDDDKPLIGQISRFDKWKDPVGVIRIFKEVRKKVDCRLVMCGSMATDDPEGQEIYEEVHAIAKPMIDKGDIIFINSQNNVLVNTLQRKFAVAIQKSLKEGFGLTVTESMWKQTPVVASNVGGISLQIKNGVNGYTLDPLDITGFSERIVHLLKNPERAKEIGKNAKKTVKEKYLITRLVKNYLDIVSDALS